MTSPARMPERNIRTSIADVNDNDPRWIASYAIFVDDQHGAWLDGTCTAARQCGDSNVIPLRKQNGGYDIWVDDAHCWIAGGAGRDPQMIPVHAIYTSPPP